MALLHLLTTSQAGAVAAAAAAAGLAASAPVSLRTRHPVASHPGPQGRRSSSSFTGAPLQLGSTAPAGALRAARAASLAPVKASIEKTALRLPGDVTAESGKVAKAGELYVAEVTRPTGVKFAKGTDKGTYVEYVEKDSVGAEAGIEIGDKVIETTAVFGTEMWPAAEFGRTMYSIKQRVGTIKLVMRRGDGSLELMKERVDKWLTERNSGNVGYATMEQQAVRYKAEKEKESQREVSIQQGMELYQAGKIEEALLEFQIVIGLNPTLREEQVANYNAACCYGRLGKIDEGLLSLDSSLKAGFDDYKAVRSDPDLAPLRGEQFTEIINRYDEPFINENAVKALKSVFGIFGGKK